LKANTAGKKIALTLGHEERTVSSIVKAVINAPESAVQWREMKLKLTARIQDAQGRLFACRNGFAKLRQRGDVAKESQMMKELEDAEESLANLNYLELS